MPTYVIERTIAGAGAMTDDEWKGAAAQSNATLDALAAEITWIHSYATVDKVYCVHEAQNPDVIHEHGRQGGFPVDSVTDVSRVIDPTTAAT